MTRKQYRWPFLEEANKFDINNKCAQDVAACKDNIDSPNKWNFITPFRRQFQASKANSIIEKQKKRLIENKKSIGYAKERKSLKYCDKNSKDFSFQDGFLSQWSLALLLLVVLITNDTPACYGFGLFERNHNYGHFIDPPDYQWNPLITSRQQRSSLFSSLWSQQPNNYYARQSNNDPITNMQTIPNGLSSLLDQSSSNDQGTIANSWTSIFNPFGVNSNNNGQSQLNIDSLDKHVKKILVPRVSGTQGNIEVRQYIVDELNKNNYQTELDEFNEYTPVGSVKFANIIASSDPAACRQLVLACHYDSKMMEGFLGATDSAVPCAMLLKMAETFKDSYRPNSDSDRIGLRFIFFDGEEAFVQWTKTDSLYGSRHLASKWAKQAAPKECQKSSGKKVTELDRIDLFVLLDLIGTSSTTFVQYSSNVKHHYQALQTFEKEHIVRSKPNASQSQVKRESAFKNRLIGLDLVEDDHVPFKQRGVPILLLLAHPFPDVWHTINDNYQAIDYARTRRIQYALEKFVANYSSQAAS